ncbi:dihydrolipoamide acetyltransferase family protein [Alicyclobacillus ferrooxydans]|uniref:Dihydrolipoamide acetyltransferase component of pyruvate dehydrogenase complex n=1 Tax=Alicyclobacillus ferrooxydans TaxID=471514 RepID=A0A0N8PP71_9BACL|nr:dihydrolipoamide acetyltransferase family protein [Alicyclobacillus ferrooxydans]KPV43509.1 branched-chain alpha-keto acid dehydrogenase subunit E2 [Alicyclobacillus ferrooxydans]
MPDIKMPQLGESVTEGTIGKWLKAVGDPVSKYEPIAEVITDKVTAEVPSDFDGIMAELLIAEGDTVKVGTVICRIETEVDASGNHAAEADQVTPGHPKEASSDEATRSNGSLVKQRMAEVPTDTGERPIGRFSPAVLRIAEEKGIDLSRVTGTGEGGRITRKDVLAYAEASAGAAASAASQGVDSTALSATEVRSDAAISIPATEVPSSGAGTRTAPHDDEEWVTPSPIRKTIAKRMVESKHNAPHAWTMVEADVTSLSHFRTRMKADFKRREGIDLTYLPFFIKAVVEAVKRYPIMNASWIDDKIVMHKRINISIAVATDDALVVPVIHDADRLSIAGLAHKVNELAAKARSGRLTMADIEGGTFTVNNTGAFGSVLSQPILNSPQAGILSVESIVKRPVVVEGDAIAVRSMVNLCLSLDHRVLDGWVAGQFLRAVRERLSAFDDNTVLY